MLTRKDKEQALRDLEIINKQDFNSIFGEYAQTIFLCTDKIPVLREIIPNMKKCMIPASSGESAIELAQYDIDVYTYDINALSYYAEQLRIAATKGLEYKEFLAFFYRFEESEIFLEKYYEKLRDNLMPRAKFLLDKMFSSMRGDEILIKLFDIVRLCPSFLSRPEHYMEIGQTMFSVNQEEGFYKAKEVDLQNKIKFARFDILDLAMSDYKDERDFDMLFFSNILYSLSMEEKINFINMLKGFYQEYLKDGGALVNYFHSMDGAYRHNDLNLEYLTYDEQRTEEIEILGGISDDFYEIGPGMNGMGLYQNDVVHLIKKV